MATYRRKDAYYQRAKAAGYRSRAAYKLLALAERYRVLRPGDHVVDLGAWPGGWLQVAAELVGERGRVVGVDVVPIQPLNNAVVTCLRGDAGDAEVAAELLRLCGGRVDVVLSDMAPKLTGVRAADTARGATLAHTAAEVAARLLRPDGHLLLKVFTGPDTDALVRRLRQRFRSVKLTRPPATRTGSAELYVIALGFVRSS